MKVKNDDESDGAGESEAPFGRNMKEDDTNDNARTEGNKQRWPGIDLRI